MKQTKLNFNGVAVLCSTWQQMLHLADLAEMQGYARLPLYLDEDDFNDGHTLFAVNDLGFIGNWCKTNVPIIPYTTFINPPTDESVYGC